MSRVTALRSRFIFCAIGAIDPGFCLMTMNNAIDVGHIAQQCDAVW